MQDSTIKVLMDNFKNFDKRQREDHDTLIKVDGKVDGIVESMDTFTKSLESLKDQEIKTLRDDITSLQKWKSDFVLTYKLILGAATTISSVVGFVVSVLVDRYL